MAFRLALVGTGSIAGTHARAIQNQPDAEIAAVVTTKAGGAAAFRAEYQIPAAYASLGDLIQAGGVDALVICTPNALHAPQAIQALKAGLAVLVEKPMATTVADAQAMLDASRSSGSPLMVAHCLRFDTEVNWLKDQLTAGRLGTIFRTKGYGVHVHWGPSGWFTQQALAGGGALVDMGIHAIDTVRYLLDDPQPLSVYARLSTHFIDGDVDDTGLMLITWDNGVVSYIESGWWQPHSDGPEAATQLYGSQGFGSVFPTRLELPNPAEDRIETIDPGFPYPREEQDPQEMYDRQMAYFIECARSGRTPIPGGQEGLANTRVTEMAYASARSGQVITASEI
mgnify:CR=1 FL=1